MITVQRLSQLRYLKHEIEAERERLVELRGLAEFGARQTDGMPKGSRKSNRVARFAVEMSYLQQLIADNMQRAVCELLRLQQFINEIEDSELRLIFFYRYIKCLSWQNVAFRMGQYDEQLPRKKHDRYLRTLAQKESAQNQK